MGDETIWNLWRLRARNKAVATAALTRARLGGDSNRLQVLRMQSVRVGSHVEQHARIRARIRTRGINANVPSAVTTTRLAIAIALRASIRILYVCILIKDLKVPATSDMHDWYPSLNCREPHPPVQR